MKGLKKDHEIRVPNYTTLLISSGINTVFQLISPYLCSLCIPQVFRKHVSLAALYFMSLEQQSKNFSVRQRKLKKLVLMRR